MAFHAPFAYILPPAELEVMHVLWDRATATAGEVRAALPPERPLAYVTVKTTMDRLARKGLLRRIPRRTKPGYTYAAVQSRAELLGQAFLKLCADLGLSPADGAAVLQTIEAPHV